MALHTKSNTHNDLLDDIYGSADLERELPKYKFPTKEREASHIYNAVHDELMLDGNSRQHNVA